MKLSVKLASILGMLLVGSVYAAQPARPSIDTRIQHWDNTLAALKKAGYGEHDEITHWAEGNLKRAEYRKAHPHENKGFFKRKRKEHTAGVGYQTTAQKEEEHPQHAEAKKRAEEHRKQTKHTADNERKAKQETHNKSKSAEEKTPRKTMKERLAERKEARAAAAKKAAAKA